MSSNASRRNFIRRTAALTGGAFAAAGTARAAPLAIPPTNQEPGRIIEDIHVDIPRPRPLKGKRTQQFLDYEDRIWSLIEAQVKRGMFDQDGAGG